MWGLRGVLAIRKKTKIVEDGESWLDDAFGKKCDIFGFEKLNKHQEMKSDGYVNLPTGYGYLLQ